MENMVPLVNRRHRLFGSKFDENGQLRYRRIGCYVPTRIAERSVFDIFDA
jgi:hypothetical protein